MKYFLTTHLHTQYRRAVRPERGQILLILVLLQLVLLLIVGLGIDSAHLYSQRRAAQSAADLSALVGANHLPDAPSDASNAARTNAASNGFTDLVAGDNVTVVTPYSADDLKLEVTVKRSVSPYFMQVFGIGSIPVSARAVAIHDRINYAIFAGSSACGGGVGALHMSGSNHSTTGGNVHSNSKFMMSGSSNTIADAATYVCSSSVGGSSNTFGSGPTQARVKAYPVDFERSDFLPCTYTRAGAFDVDRNGLWWVGGNKSSKQLKPGVYCATGRISLSTQSVQGNVTFVTDGDISMSGNDSSLTAFSNGVVLYTSSTDGNAIKISGSDGSFGGIMYAPNGSIDLAGSGMNIQGSVIGNEIKLTGSNRTINGNVKGEGASQLIE